MAINFTNFNTGTIFRRGFVVPRITPTPEPIQVLNRSNVVPEQSLVPDRVMTTRTSTTSVTIKDRVIDKSMIPYMRQKTITFTAEGLRPGIEMSGRFAGKDVTLSNDTVSASGSLTGTFSIPTGVPTGTQSFELYDDTHGSTGCSALYTAAGQLITKQKTITSIRNVTETRTTVPERRPPVVPARPVRRRLNLRRRGWKDPIAQSFMCADEGGAYITSVELYFRTKDNTMPVSLYIVEMENGTPTDRIVPLSHVTVQAASVNTSSSAAISTKFTFGDPIYCEEFTEYAFVVRTDSDNYEAWISTLGEADVDSGIGIARQPYLGSLFKSQNATTWTADQMSDMKFIVNKAVFGSTGSVVLNNNNASDITATSLNFNIADMNLAETSTDWSFTHLGTETPIIPFENYDFASGLIDASNTSSLITTAVCNTSNTNLSPVIDKDRISVYTKLNTLISGNAGTYISQTVNLINQSDDIKVLVEAYKPVGADIDVYIKTKSYTPTYQYIGGPSDTPSTIGNDIKKEELIGMVVNIYEYDGSSIVSYQGQCIITGYNELGDSNTTGTFGSIYFKSATDITVFNTTNQLFVSPEENLENQIITSWSSGANYSFGDRVYNTVTGKIWESTVAGTGTNTNSEPSSVNSDWDEVISVSCSGNNTYLTADDVEWQAMKLANTDATDLDAESQFIQYEYIPEKTIESEFDSFSIKIDMTAANAYDVPKIKALRGIAVY